MRIGAKRLIKKAEDISSFVSRQSRNEFVDFDTVQRLAGTWGTDSVTAAYRFGRMHGADEAISDVVSYVADFDHKQRVSEALSILNDLTSDEYNALMGRFYNGTH